MDGNKSYVSYHMSDSTTNVAATPISFFWGGGWEGLVLSFQVLPSGMLSPSDPGLHLTLSPASSSQTS